MTEGIFSNLIEKMRDLKNTKEIMWYDKNEIDITKFLSAYKSSNIYDNLDIDFTSYENCEISGIFDVDKYIIIADDLNTLYISIGQCHPLFWYVFINMDELLNSFDNIYEIYSHPNVLQYTNNIKGFIGNEEMLELNIHDIENHLLLNSYTDKMIWGSLWKQHPYRNEYESGNTSHIDSIIYTGQAMRQNEYEYTVSVLTEYSKSEIKIIHFDEAYIINVRYNPIKSSKNTIINELFKRNYPEDLPIDIIIAIINFPFITYNKLINMRPFSMFHFYILLNLVENDGKKTELYEDLQKIIDDTNNQTDQEVKDEIKSFIDHKIIH
ncbi:hypothetical protein Klosneuvirus_2_73 [Klosneuvirus KNV1]|uniref:Uncharacterized protein n=1 Tax=Klosneuvirus KNV1 TaxID=1977640 RepID=A0A1V0SIT8_9VIRU|nr:hypothetical protein Klosneuvirus_2_73 [Klosneuvirus KNV1]